MTMKKKDAKEAAAESTPARVNPCPVSTWETITPDIAREMIKRANPNNRTLVPEAVKAMIEEMRSGLWRETHQGIAEGADGILYDAHHRLQAIIESGVTVRMLVTRGLSKEALDAIDRGRVRKAHEIVQMADGVVDKVMVRAGCMVAYWLVKRGNLLPVWGQNANAPNDLRAARTEHLAAVTEICDAFGGTRSKLSTAPVVGALAICHRTNAVMAAKFAAELHSGTGYSDGSPVLALRDHIMTKHIASGAVARDDLSLYVFSAFDSYVHGRKREHIKPSESARTKYLAPWRKEGSGK